MSNEKYKEALHQAQEELAGLEQRRATLLRLIQNLKELSEDDRYELTPPPGYVPKGLTEEIRTILSLTTVHLDATQIRDGLVLRGVEYRSPKNLLINVHTVLVRIAGELDIVERDGKPTYKAKNPFDIASILTNVEVSVKADRIRNARRYAGAPGIEPPTVSRAAREALPPPPGSKEKEK